ncbi:MAG: PhzF family phenazine biosynthesis protein [Stellaceae bacterium]
MKLPFFQIDAFAARAFAGNPAAVCPLEDWLDDTTLQRIAAENNLSETAFFVAEDDGFRLRWFTPAVEVDLCGHATLATAWVIFHEFDWPLDTIDFTTRSGALAVTREDDRLAMDFPARPPVPAEGVAEVAAALGARPQSLLAARDALAVFADAAEVEALAPDFARLKALDHFAVIATAPGRAGDADFVSRFFAPKVGVDEDPVTGSAHSTLIPYWSRRLGKKRLFARQVSARGGELWCEANGDRVSIAGHCVPVIEGMFRI